MNARFDLSGKAAIVTGSTRGLGRAIAEALIEAGARVIISSENEADTQRAAAELNQTGLVCDVADDAAVKRLVDGALSILGKLDILICNAGITGTPGPFAQIDMDDFDQVMAVNLRSQVVLTRNALPHIADRGGGAVILMSSIAGLRGNGALNAYALSKAGVSQLARNLAVEWGPKNIRVNAIAPGFIRTDMAAALMADYAFMQRRMQMTPLRRPGEPEEIAGAALFLASPAGAFVTGQTLIVDGGTLITDGS